LEAVHFGFILWIWHSDDFRNTIVRVVWCRHRSEDDVFVEFLLQEWPNSSHDADAHGEELCYGEYSKEMVELVEMISGGTGLRSDLVSAVSCEERRVVATATLHQHHARITRIKVQRSQKGLNFCFLFSGF
jgi:hypothetical protein